MLIDEFKRCIHHDIRTFLDDQKADTLEDASRLSDDYALTHKSSFVSKPPQSVEMLELPNIIMYTKVT